MALCATARSALQIVAKAIRALKIGIRNIYFFMFHYVLRFLLISSF